MGITEEDGGFYLQGKQLRGKISPSSRGTVPGKSLFRSQGSVGSFSSVFPHTSSLWFYSFAVFVAGSMMLLEHLLVSKVWWHGSCSQVMLSQALGRTVKAVKSRYLLQGSVYVANPCAAALCSSEERELSKLLPCAHCICSARDKNLPVLFLLFLCLGFPFVSFQTQSRSVQFSRGRTMLTMNLLLCSN